MATFKPRIPNFRFKRVIRFKRSSTVNLQRQVVTQLSALIIDYRLAYREPCGPGGKPTIKSSIAKVSVSMHWQGKKFNLFSWYWRLDQQVATVLWGDHRALFALGQHNRLRSLLPLPRCHHPRRLSPPSLPHRPPPLQA